MTDPDFPRGGDIFAGPTIAPAAPLPPQHLNLSGRLAYEVDPAQGGGVYTLPIYVEWRGQDDPLLLALLERVRSERDERMARNGPGTLDLG